MVKRKSFFGCFKDFSSWPEPLLILNLYLPPKRVYIYSTYSTGLGIVGEYHPKYFRKEAPGNGRKAGRKKGRKGGAINVLRF